MLLCISVYFCLLAYLFQSFGASVKIRADQAVQWGDFRYLEAVAKVARSIDFSNAT